MTRARALDPSLQTSPAGRRALRAPGQPAARARARGGTYGRLLAGAAPRAAVPETRPAQGGTRRRPAPANAPRDDRVVIRPARRRRAEAVSSAVGLRRRVHVRVRRGDLLRGARHAPVAARQEPASPPGGRARPSLLDARDDPRARGREARRGGRDRRRAPPSRRALPRPRPLANLDAEASGQQRHDSSSRARQHACGAWPGRSRTSERELGIELFVALENFWATSSPQEGVDWRRRAARRNSGIPDRLSSAASACTAAWRMLGRSISPSRRWERGSRDRARRWVTTRRWRSSCTGSRTWPGCEETCRAPEHSPPRAWPVIAGPASEG